MLDATDRDISTSMLRLWGQDAAEVALGYAGCHEAVGNETAAARWHNVARLVVETQRPITNTAKRTREQDFAAVIPDRPSANAGQRRHSL